MACERSAARQSMVQKATAGTAHRTCSARMDLSSWCMKSSFTLVFLKPNPQCTCSSV